MQNFKFYVQLQTTDKESKFDNQSMYDIIFLDMKYVGTLKMPQNLKENKYLIIVPNLFMYLHTFTLKL
jgi:hypothetical protein